MIEVKLMNGKWDEVPGLLLEIMSFDLGLDNMARLLSQRLHHHCLLLVMITGELFLEDLSNRGIFWNVKGIKVGVFRTESCMEASTGKKL